MVSSVSNMLISILIIIIENVFGFYVKKQRSSYTQSQIDDTDLFISLSLSQNLWLLDFLYSFITVHVGSELHCFMSIWLLVNETWMIRLLPPMTPFVTYSFQLTCRLLKCILHFKPWIIIISLLQIPSREVDKSEGKFWTQWNADTKQVQKSKII